MDFFGSLGKDTKEEFEAGIAPMTTKLQLLEKEIKGPYFNGDKVCPPLISSHLFIPLPAPAHPVCVSYNILDRADRPCYSSTDYST